MNFRALFRLWLARRPAAARRDVASQKPRLYVESLEGRYAAGDVLVSIATLTSILAPAAASDIFSRTDDSTTAPTDLSSTPPPHPASDTTPIAAPPSPPPAAGAAVSSRQPLTLTNQVSSSLPELAGISHSNTEPEPYVPPRSAGGSGGGGGSSGGSAGAPLASASAGSQSSSSSSTNSAGTPLPPPTSSGSQPSASGAASSTPSHAAQAPAVSPAAGAAASPASTSPAAAAASTPAASSPAAAAAAASANSSASAAVQPATTTSALTILAPAYTSSSNPTITVVGDSTMDFTVTPVRIDIDYQQDGTFGDAGDRNVPVQVISIGGPNNNYEVLTLPTLGTGTWNVRARVGSASALTSINVNTPDTTSQSVTFEPNMGQTTAGVQFVSMDDAYTTFLTSNGAVLSLPDEGQGSSTLQMQIVKANVSGETTQMLQQVPGITNYLIGNVPANWTTNVPNYAAVQYTNIYHDVNLTYTADHGNLEYQFTVLPGNSPSGINLGFTLGSSQANMIQQVLPNGDLLLLDTSTYNVVVLPAPTMYQVDGQGNQTTVQGGYEINNGTIGFTVGTYNTSENLVIDPALTFSTFLGGPDDDVGQAIAVDASGNSYVAGTVTGNNATATGNNPLSFPLSSTTLPSSENGNSTTGVQIGFVAKFDTNGNRIYTTFLGGNGTSQSVGGIAIDSSGDAYVDGDTTAADFPTVNAYQTSAAGDHNGYLSVINPTGSELLYSTYFSGGADDFGTAIAVSGTTAYMCGTTFGGISTTPGVVQTTGPGSNTDTSFVAVFNTAGSGPSSLLICTYIGGTLGGTQAYGIALDSSNNVYLTGTTFNFFDFPLSGGFGQSPLSFNQNAAFVMELNPTLTAYTYSGLLGVSTGASSIGRAIAVDSTGDAYVGGSTSDPNFDVTTGAYETTHPAGFAEGTSAGTGFVVKIAAGGTSIVYSTYLGGDNEANDYDEINGIAVDSSGDAYAAGQTSSPDFPLVNSVQTPVSGVDFYGTMSILNPSGSALIFSSYLGATAATTTGDLLGTQLNGVALDPSNNIYVTGATGDNSFLIANPATAFQATYGGYNTDAIVAKFAAQVIPTPSPTPTPTPTPTPPSSPTGSLYPDDQFEPNETEDAATNFGVIQPGTANDQSQSNLTINIHADGTPDYDWYTWQPGTTGLFTATLDVTATGTPTSLLEIHMFTVNSDNTLIAGPTLSVGAGLTESVSILLGAGQSIYVEVKGANSSPGYRDQGVYNLTADLG